MKLPFPAIVSTIKKSKDTLAEAADVAISAADSAKLLDDIPIISTAIKVFNIRDEYLKSKLTRNCLEFMEAVKDADKATIERLTLKLSINQEFSDEFTDNFMMLFYDAQKPLKCKVAGRLMLAMADDKIDSKEFLKLTEMLHACTVPALKAIESFFISTSGKPYKSGPGTIQEEPLLLSLGVCHRFGNMFRVDTSGQNLYQYGFNGIVDNQ